MAAQARSTSAASFGRRAGSIARRRSSPTPDGSASARPRICCAAPASEARPTTSGATRRCAPGRRSSVVARMPQRRCDPAPPPDARLNARWRRSSAAATRARTSLEPRCSCGGSTGCSTSPAPLQEKMALYFHGHFTSRATPRFPRDYLQAERALPQLRARQSARADAQRLQRSGDADLSQRRRQRRRASQRKLRARADGALYARRRATITEDDVRESARAWTGWHVDRRSASAAVQSGPPR